MNILILGGGGREHALAWRLAQDSRVSKIWAAPGNPGMPALPLNLKLDDHIGLVDFVKQNDIGLTVVGPEAPLFDGIVDVFRKKNLPIFGPTKMAAEIERSKIFSKEIMAAAGIPTAESKVFGEFEAALGYVNQLHGQCVVKAPGPALGKGAFVCRSVEEAQEALEAILVRKDFGDDPALIEDLMTGPEASFYVITDGTNLLPLPAAQDHKTIHDGDTGPMTGGMGAYAPTPVFTQYDEVLETVVVPFLHAMKSKGYPYTGVLFVGLMLTPAGPRVIEFNARFGDPETQPLMMLWEEGLLDALLASAGVGSFEALEDKVRFAKGAASCVVMASAGYPASSTKGCAISGLETLPSDCVVFHAGTKKDGSEIVTNGGRVLGVSARAATLKEATANAYAGVEAISFDGAQFRRDIGHQVL